jgi:hypothetical protein
MLLVIALAGIPWAATSNPNAIPQAKQLLQYLVNLSGQKILSGQESMFSAGAFPSSDVKTVFQKTGKYPAIYTSDFGDVNTGNLSDRNKVVSNAISYHAKGSIIAFQYHMTQPNLPDGSGFSAMNIKGSTWHGFESTTYNSDALYMKNYGAPSVITQDELAIPTTAVFPFANNFGNGVKALALSPEKSPDVLYTLQGRVIKNCGRDLVLPEGFYFSNHPQVGKSLIKILSKNRF